MQERSEPRKKRLGHLTDTTCSLSVIIMCRTHLDLLEKTTHSGLSHRFHAATRRIQTAIVNGFGDRSVPEIIDSLNAIELQDRPASNTEHVVFDEFPLEELENAPPEVSLNLGKPSFSLSFLS